MYTVQEPVVWLAGVSFVAALLYLFRDSRVIHWEYFSKYYIFLFMVFTGFVLLSDLVNKRFILYFASLAVILPAGVVLADIILQAFLKIKELGLFGRYFKGEMPPYIREICRTIEILAAKKRGALLVIERGDDIDDFLKDGVPYDAEINADVVAAMFEKNSAVHDGAVVITDGRISKVKTVLPLQTDALVPMGVGTRHRAAIGISERTDAIALAVSEERGEVSIARRGSLIKVRSRDELMSALQDALRVF